MKIKTLAILAGVCLTSLSFAVPFLLAGSAGLTTDPTGTFSADYGSYTTSQSLTAGINSTLDALVISGQFTVVYNVTQTGFRTSDLDGFEWFFDASAQTDPSVAILSNLVLTTSSSGWFTAPYQATWFNEHYALLGPDTGDHISLFGGAGTMLPFAGSNSVTIPAYSQANAGHLGLWNKIKFGPNLGPPTSLAIGSYTYIVDFPISAGLSVVPEPAESLALVVGFACLRWTIGRRKRKAF